jgi:SAM-dependent methyltransferase
VNVYDDIARYYDADFGDYSEDIHFYQEMARRTGDPILDVMCGSGRVLLPLAESGYSLTGLDSSAPMLALARSRLEHAGLLARVSLQQGDIRSSDLPAQHFALAFVAVNSFMHLERVKDQLAALTSLRHTLQPDGLLILDLFNPDPEQLNREDNRLTLERIYPMDGRQVFKFVASESDMAAQTNAMTYMFDDMDADGHITRRVMRFTLRWLYRYELEHLLARAGFALRMVYGSYDLDSYTSASERMIAVATPARQP